jgi:23S rRNA pseudouridine1911/1915/1917 synthase
VTNLSRDISMRSLGKPVSEDQAGMRIDSFLSDNFLFLTRAGWQKKIRSSMVRVGGRVIKGSYKIKAGDQISYMQDIQDEPEVDTNIKLLYEDEGVLAIFKPGYLPMHENGPWKKNTFAYLIQQEFGEDCAAVHRLDRETSGIVLCSRDYGIRKNLSNQWVQGEVEKEYLAICNGVPTTDEFKVDAPIGDAVGSIIRIKKSVNPQGLESLTEFRCEQRAIDHSLVRAFPKTGRTNQIRVHLAHIGHVIVGDKMYHPDEKVFDDYYRFGDGENIAEKTGFYRHLLHAAKITFTHPNTGERISVECEMPADMNAKWQEITAHCHKVLN